jgi:CubicO group peptidase (beta-lactamase class C family)
VGKNIKAVIKGTVAPGFESVKQLYTRNMNRFSEEHSQLCIYHKGEKVVDLWASAEDPGQFSADSLINVFSSGKSLESIALASLVSKGLLRFEEKVTEYWPEFGANGKSELTVADLMRHEAGLANFTVSIEPEHLQAANIKQNKIGQTIENEPLQYPGDGTYKREYHAVTRGWVVNEIFRRVDPQGRTMGEFLQEDINGPLEVEARVGLNEEELPRVNKVRHRGFGFELLESLKPKFLGRRVFHSIFKLLGRILRIIPKARKRMTRGAPVPYAGMDGILFFNEDSVALGETPSANTKSSARTLAKIAAVMSAGGSYSGREYLSQSAWESLHANPTEEVMGGAIPTQFTQGGVNQFPDSVEGSSVLERDFNGGREGFFGWMGLGGSIFQWNPKLDIGFGFTVTELHVLDFFNERGKVYQAEAMHCIRALEDG